MEGLPEGLEEKKILVVGAGGIGCELLKNLVLTGFSNIDIVDLDTIDVSNLNRQFLFHKQHVGQSKAKVACESVLQFAPQAKVNYFHSSIMSSDFNVTRFKEYSLVLNALDNRAARIHVNRMCLAADVPLVESGSAGYLGQVSVIKKSVTECYECVPKSAEKSYPGCTIRNTPSEPIHCIVWAKHVFNQIFGEADIDEDVSPDMTDPELQQINGSGGGDSVGEQNGSEGSTEVNGTTASGSGAGGIDRVSTRKWAENVSYDTTKLFNKLFHDDIQYLLSMANLWKKRQPPIPLAFDTVPSEAPGSSKPNEPALIKDKIIQTPIQYRDMFLECVLELKERLSKKEDTNPILIWDKDDDISMNFVCACANLRSFIFGIPLKSRFDIKSMAGNIIPAIATTNAVIAGLIVMEALKILKNEEDKIRSCFLVRKPNPKGKIIVDMIPDPPNKKCYVCSSGAKAAVKLNTRTFTLKLLEDKVLKHELGMLAPDVSIADSGNVIISSEEGETTHLSQKTLFELGVGDGTILACDDFMQELQLRLEINNAEDLQQDEFQVTESNADQKTMPILKTLPQQRGENEQEEIFVS